MIIACPLAASSARFITFRTNVRAHFRAAPFLAPSTALSNPAQRGHALPPGVPAPTAPRTDCVIVKPQLPLAESVVFGGYEPNAVLAQGTN